MTAIESYTYVQDRLNKLSSNAGDNLPKHTFVRAYNAVQLQWVEDRVKLSEVNTVRKDEIQQLIKTKEQVPSLKTNYYEMILPEDYFHYIRSTSQVPCEIRNILVEEGNINTFLQNENWKPSIEWGETLCTIGGNTLKIYVDNFVISQVNLVYYRYPVKINLEDGFNDVNGVPTETINPEFQGSSLIEILNMVVELISGDIKDQLSYQIANQRGQKLN